MVSRKDSNAQRLKRHARVRGKISGTAERPRLCVYRSNITNKPVAVYYGDVEAPDCKDKLYGAYNIFDRGRKK